MKHVVRLLAPCGLLALCACSSTMERSESFQRPAAALQSPCVMPVDPPAVFRIAVLNGGSRSADRVTISQARISAFTRNQIEGLAPAVVTRMQARGVRATLCESSATTGVRLRLVASNDLAVDYAGDGQLRLQWSATLDRQELNLLTRDAVLWKGVLNATGTPDGKTDGEGVALAAERIAMELERLGWLPPVRR